MHLKNIILKKYLPNKIRYDALAENALGGLCNALRALPVGSSGAKKAFQQRHGRQTHIHFAGVHDHLIAGNRRLCIQKCTIFIYIYTH
jgi:hypothetical protein